MINQRLPSFAAVQLAAAICFGCQSRSDGQADHPVLKVSLEECSVSLSDLFERAELVLLPPPKRRFSHRRTRSKYSTTRSSCSDRSSRALHIFAPDGDPIRSIRKIGRGPGRIHDGQRLYDRPGTADRPAARSDGPTPRIRFRRDIPPGTFTAPATQKLPLPVEWLAPNNCVTWSSVYETGQDAVRILDRENRIRHSAFSPFEPVGDRCVTAPFSTDTAIRSTTMRASPAGSMRLRPTAAASPTNGTRASGRLIPGGSLWDKNALAAAQQQLFADYRDGTIPFFFSDRNSSPNAIITRC